MVASGNNPNGELITRRYGDGTYANRQPSYDPAHWSPIEMQQERETRIPPKEESRRLDYGRNNN